MGDSQGNQVKVTAPTAEILVVDDSRTVRNHLGHILSKEFRCTFACDGESALRQALEHPPDSIISDVVMEPFDGHELCRRVRSEPELQNIPFIFLTSSSATDGRAIGLEEGADDYLSKQVGARELFARVRSLIRLRRAQQEILRQKQQIASAHDELLSAQRQLLESEKLATLGTISAGVAHEINNPLSVVLSGIHDLANWSRILANPGNKTPVKDVLEDVKSLEGDIHGCLTRIKAVVDNLALMTKSLQAAPSLIDAREEMDRALAIAAPKLSGITVQTRLSPCPVQATPGMLSQVLVSLLHNAVDALAGRPSPRIEVIAQPHQGGIELVVSDNGRGIPSDILPRIFEPFFTTKPAGQGTGLGLSVCYGIVQRLGGTLAGTSEVGKGAQFRMWIPERPRERIEHLGTFNPVPRNAA